MPGVSDIATLSEMPLFKGLTEEQLHRINQRLHRTSFPAGTHIFMAEQPGDVMYIILSGTVKIHAEQEDGSDVIVAFRGAGDPIGEMSVLDQGGRSTSVSTVEPTTVLWMDRASFQQFLQTMPAMALNLLEICSRRLREATEQIQALAAQDVYGRVARLLLVFAQERGQINPDGSILIPLRLTQSDIADCVGATRVHVNKIVGTLKRQKWIAVDKDFRVTVLDPTALQRILY